MKPTRNNIFLCFSAIPIVIHFYLLNQTIINFPGWGDDFLFVELIEHYQKDSWRDFGGFLFKPHNQIHILFFGKVFTLFAYLIFGSLQFKYIILLGNLLLLGIATFFYKYLQAQKFSTAHFISITCILFAPMASIDQYNLIGVLQHTGSLFFLTLIAYVAASKKHSVILCIAAICYPLVSTEGWAMLPLLTMYMYLAKHPLRKLMLLLSILGISIFGYFLVQHPQPGESHSVINMLFQAPIALLSFLGNTAWPISDSYKIELNALWGAILVFLSLYFLRKNKQWEMPGLLLLQILATGAMICIGRSQGNSITTLILSERFYTYASFAMIGTYLLGIPHFNKSNIRLNMILLFSCLYFTGSFYYWTKRQDALHNRLRADLTNAYQSASLLNYPAAPEQIRMLMEAKYFEVDKETLLTCARENPTKFQALKSYSLDERNGQLSLQLNDIPEKVLEADQRWLAIQSVTNPDSSYLVSFIRDQAKKPRLVHINSLQLTNLRGKNIWLYTQKANGTKLTQYLGSL